MDCIQTYRAQPNSPFNILLHHCNTLIINIILLPKTLDISQNPKSYNQKEHLQPDTIFIFTISLHDPPYLSIVFMTFLSPHPLAYKALTLPRLYAEVPTFSHLASSTSSPDTVTKFELVFSVKRSHIWMRREEGVQGPSLYRKASIFTAAFVFRFWYLNGSKLWPCLLCPPLRWGQQLRPRLWWWRWWWLWRGAQD